MFTVLIHNNNIIQPEHYQGSSYVVVEDLVASSFLLFCSSDWLCSPPASFISTSMLNPLTSDFPAPQRPKQRGHSDVTSANMSARDERKSDICFLFLFFFVMVLMVSNILPWILGTIGEKPDIRNKTIKPLIISVVILIFICQRTYIHNKITPNSPHY